MALDAANLLTALHHLQEEHGWLSDEVLRAYAEESRIPLYRLQEVASFYPHYRRSPPPRAEVAVCRDAACHLAGGGAFLAAVRGGVADDPGVTVREVSCLGRCEHAPAACVNDVPLLGWGAAEVAAAARNARALPPDEPTEALRRWPVDPYASLSDRYGMLRQALEDRTRAVATIPDRLKEAGLRGMGGAGFPTGLKWRLVRDAAGPQGKYAVVNADESEPGTFKDRVILEELPHLVVEGLLLGCVVAGAAEGIVYIRHEYGRERKAVEREIARARAAGLLAQAGADLRVFVSPGGYILGEETALLEALEGRRGEPRNKPPYPTTHGLHGQPTLMNNVETFAFVPPILAEGPEAWKAHGTNGGTGWKFLSLCGHVERPGVYCVPMGTTVRTLVEEQGGGVSGGRRLKAFSPGGASAPFLPASALDTPLDFEPMAEAGSMLGSGAVLVVAEGTDMLDLGANLVRFFRNESCGKCVPCRVGSQKAVEILDEALAGRAPADAFAGFADLDEALRETSICGLGQVVLNPVTSVMRHFPEEVEARLGRPRA
jgi:NADH:ubiquinone oxidoreductase subunit F (NADH-binding)/NADH:ubiquinone oxidoreductase subunit E